MNSEEMRGHAVLLTAHRLGKSEAEVARVVSTYNSVLGGLLEEEKARRDAEKEAEKEAKETTRRRATTR